jgi:hypothetical protein
MNQSGDAHNANAYVRNRDILPLFEPVSYFRHFAGLEFPSPNREVWML